MQNSERYLLIRVDLCTMSDFSIGLSNILTILKSFDIRATFFAAMGPDNLGRVGLRRLFSKKFIRQVYHMNPIRTYGLKNLMSGLITEGPILSVKCRDKMEKISEAGHEIAIHGYDHAKWSDYYMRMSQAEIKGEIDKAVDNFRHTFGRLPFGFAAPSWGCNFSTLKVQEMFNFLYASDTRGRCPFFPKINNQVFKTLQIPVTLPTFFELLSENQNDKSSIVEKLVLEIKQKKINVLIVHPCQEGRANRELFINLLNSLKQEKITYITHEGLARMILSRKTEIPVCEVYPAQVFGAFREVGSQQ